MTNPMTHGAMGGGVGGFLPHAPGAGSNPFDFNFLGTGHGGSALASGQIGAGGASNGPLSFGLEMLSAGGGAPATPPAMPSGKPG
ncbi:hypothetical protein FHS89_002345 [Rubricella aquisinus]|uniref:Uncharacterized protein n=1 Tax=Rubricella aquisinus TaxID=2028108 RepID=A0A840WMN5_9RHOB|nr:hypothetical protein [Rubricella aquisinus]MBB5516319.1 hypothetical protein [Rubricella aquisinus]